MAQLNVNALLHSLFSLDQCIQLDLQFMLGLKKMLIFKIMWKISKKFSLKNELLLNSMTVLNNEKESNIEKHFSQFESHCVDTIFPDSMGDFQIQWKLSREIPKTNLTVFVIVE